jgi:hypothetical protein
MNRIRESQPQGWLFFVNMGLFDNGRWKNALNEEKVHFSL